MRKPKVSVIIPAYNSGDYIEECLISVLKQTLGEIEIIIIDDNSSDNTAGIIENFASKDNRIKVIKHKKNSGQGAARNKGIKIAQGEYIGFVDADDYIDCDYFEKLYNTAVEFNSDIAVASILKHKKYYNKYNVKYTQKVYATDITAKIKLCEDTKKNFFYAWNKIYKTSMVKENNIEFEEGHIYEDVPFAIKTLYYSKSVVSTPETSYHYIEHKKSTINSKDNKNRKRCEYIALHGKLQTFAKEKGIILSEKLNYYTHYWFSPFIKSYVGQYHKKDLLFGLIPIKKENINYDFPIDLVYCWVDGNDTDWQIKKKYHEQNSGRKSYSDAGRFVDNEELKFSLRSVEKYAPWINKIYIVTDNQIPTWLDINNPKVKVIFHKDFIQKEYLPLFNSEAIETFLSEIPELSEHFLYACDDMFINKFVSKQFFFDGYGYPIIRLKHQVSLRHKRTSMYTRSILYQQKVIKEKFNKKYPCAPHHNIDAYRKEDFKNCLNLYKKEFELTASHKFRADNDIQRVAVLYYMLAVKHGISKYYARVDRYLSPARRILNTLKSKYSTDSITIPVQDKNPMQKLDKYNPFLFCINDSEEAANEDRERIKNFLKKYFPKKSSFEI